MTTYKGIDELEKNFGKHYFKLLECKLVLNEKAIPFMQKENALSTKYDKIILLIKIFCLIKKNKESKKWKRNLRASIIWVEKL